ncbi:hypothetical protein ACT80S_15835 [Ramlibacter sp. MAHUQ-53]|uniref:hypothetical protein n=1 Tax=unclassified Ramlibacter TaxID=2617605 RepID=UPI00363C0A16
MTIRHRRWLLRPLALGVVLASFWCGAQAQPAPQAALRAELARPLAAAQEALKNNQPAEALALARQARDVAGLTPAERVWVERMVAVAALTARQDDVALPALEFLGSNASLPAAERASFLQAQVDVATRLKDYPRLVRAAQGYLAAGGTHPSVRLAMLQALSLQGQHAAAAKAVEDLVAAGGAVPAPSERELRVMAASYRQLKDDAGYYRALKQLVARFPTPDYWGDLLSRVRNLPDFNPRLELDVYRLLEEVGGLDEADDIAYMAGLALKAGLPAQALRVLDAGFASKVLGTGAEAASHQRLRAEAARRAAEDDKGLPALEKAEADPTAQAELAEVLASRQQWARANAAYARALAAGGNRREAELRLHHAISLFKAGQVPQARAAFQAVQGDPSAVELASLWLLRVQER